jgi:hypothetical protein
MVRWSNYRYEILVFGGSSVNHKVRNIRITEQRRAELDQDGRGFSKLVLLDDRVVILEEIPNKHG